MKYEELSEELKKFVDARAAELAHQVILEARGLANQILSAAALGAVSVQEQASDLSKTIIRTSKMKMVEMTIGQEPVHDAPAVSPAG